MALEEPAVLGLNDLKTVHFGPSDVLGALSLDFRDRSDLADVERMVRSLERKIKEQFPIITNILSKRRHGRIM